MYTFACGCITYEMSYSLRLHDKYTVHDIWGIVVLYKIKFLNKIAIKKGFETRMGNKTNYVEHTM